MMDIQILLWLQEFRDGPGAVLAAFLSKMTFLGEMNTVFVIMAIIYWAIDKDFGTYLLMGWSNNRLVNGFLKVTFCAYRPWIRDERILPYGDAKVTATGYSFPSGHSMNGASLYGGTAVRKDVPKALRITLALTVLLIGFSRCFLGVHTPQDVLVGILAGGLVMYLTARLVRWIGMDRKRDLIVMGIVLFTAIMIALYAGFKPYPMDYDEAGNLIVDGAKMANDTFKGIGWCMAFYIGWILQRRFVSFSTKIPMGQRITRTANGLLGFYAMSLIIVPVVKDLIGGPLGTLVSCFIQMFFIVFIYPLCIARYEKRKK